MHTGTIELRMSAGHLTPDTSHDEYWGRLTLEKDGGGGDEWRDCCNRDL